MKIEDRYLDGTYLKNNSTWDREDSAWKASLVGAILARHIPEVRSVCEVGCGSGDILVNLQKKFPHAQYYGYDISPQLLSFWQNQRESGASSIDLRIGDFHKINSTEYDVLLMLDVFEHVRDPFTFLEESRSHAQNFIFHIPLDLSSVSVARKKPLINVRRSVGHLNFYTKDIALETLKDCGYKIIDFQYTGASLNSPRRSLQTRLASIPRRILYGINKDLGVRVLGGETLLVLAS